MRCVQGRPPRAAAGLLWIRVSDFDLLPTDLDDLPGYQPQPDDHYLMHSVPAGTWCCCAAPVRIAPTGLNADRRDP